MLFTEPDFLFLFLPLTIAVYFLSPRGGRNFVLLVASIVFYAAAVGRYTGVIFFSIFFNYLTGRVIGWARTKSGRNWSLAVGVAVNLGVLCCYKYGDFLVGNLNLMLGAGGARGLPHLTLLVGVSFFTFHALSYLIDVWRGEVTPMRNLTSFALYIMLFPQLIAGPIIRYKTIQSQFSRRVSSWEMFAEGVRRFVVGLGKKMLIANTVALGADNVFALKPNMLTPAAAWLGITCYAVQIYFDFSGYSDMAIGMGRMFGFVFPENFNYPYISQSVTEFWRRWHITLSAWFRDYLYIPMGGNRVPAWRMYFNLLTVFFLCGLWHGASWTYVTWGLYYGVFLILERVGVGRLLGGGNYSAVGKKDPSPQPSPRVQGEGVMGVAARVLRHVYLVLVMLAGWVFFKATSLSFAVVYLKRLVFIGAGQSAAAPFKMLASRTVVDALIVGAILSMPVIPWVRGRWENLVESMSDVAWQARLAEGVGLAAGGLGLAVVFVASITQSAANLYNPFIYYQF